MAARLGRQDRPADKSIRSTKHVASPLSTPRYIHVPGGWSIEGAIAGDGFHAWKVPCTKSDLSSRSRASERANHEDLCKGPHPSKHRAGVSLCVVQETRKMGTPKFHPPGQDVPQGLGNLRQARQKSLLLIHTTLALVGPTSSHLQR